MCQGRKDCQHPEKLQGEPKDCSPDQIAQCHPEAKPGEHPCKGETKD